MRGAWPAILVVLALLACGTMRISTPAVAVTRPSTSSTTNPKAVDPGSCGIASRLLSADVSATWGSTQPSVWLTEREGGLDVWYLASSRGAYQSTRLERDGSLKGTTEVLPFAGLGEASDPVIASDGGLVAIVDTVYRTPQHAEIMLTLGSPRRWSKPFAVLPGAELDDDPAMAFGNGLLAIVWNRGTYPMAPDLAVAIVTRDGRVLGGGVVEHDAQAEGLAIAPVPTGWLLLYSPTSALSRSRRGLVALAIDLQGHVVSRNVVAKGAPLWPVAAWNGHEVGVAFRDETEDQTTRRVRGVVSFLRLGPDGHLIGNAVVADQHPDPVASFRPLSLVPSDTGWWLADIASFRVSVMSARASEARVVDLEPDGRAKSSTIVSADRGASLVRLARYGAGVRGVFVEDRGAERLHAFDITCAITVPARPVDACAAHTEPFPPDRFAPLRGLAESSVELAHDLVVGYRPTAGNVFVSRMSEAGSLAWTADLGAAYHPQIAVGREHVAALIQTGSGNAQSIIVLDAAKGAVLHKHDIAVDAGTGCIAATRTGWMAVSGASYDGQRDPAVVTLADDGTPRERHDLTDTLEACSLLPTSTGFLLAYTHPGPVSETSWLFVRELDDRGRQHGAEVRIPDVSFATSPTLLRRNANPILLFEDALGRNLSAIMLDDHGGPRSHVLDIAQTYGLHAATLWGDQIVWATDNATGRRGCLDKWLVPTPP